MLCREDVPTPSGTVEIHGCALRSVPQQREGVGGFLGHHSTDTSGLEHQQLPKCCSWVLLHPEAGLVCASCCSWEEALPRISRDLGGADHLSSLHPSIALFQSMKQGCAAQIWEDAVSLCIKAELGSLDGSA